MCLLEMPRKPRLFRLDDRVLGGLDELAKAADTNTNQFVESLLFDFLKRAGKLSKEAEQLKDGRGGDHKSKEAKEAKAKRESPGRPKTDDSEPLPETRGGKRSGAGKPKSKTIDATGEGEHE
jgi:predicted transcriptional regulator